MSAIKRHAAILEEKRTLMCHTVCLMSATTCKQINIYGIIFPFLEHSLLSRIGKTFALINDKLSEPISNVPILNDTRIGGKKCSKCMHIFALNHISTQNFCF